jgi:hypothetical protein
MQGPNALLDGHEVCDCWRGANTVASQRKTSRKLALPETENRYYNNPVTHVRITYMQWFGERGLVLHRAMWDNNTSRNYTGVDTNASTLQSKSSRRQCTTLESCGVQPTAPIKRVTPLQFATTLLPGLQPKYVFD